MISNALKQELVASIEGEVRFDRATIAAYSTDASNYRQVPIGVVLPRHGGDVAAALEIARENELPILTRGGGTSLGGQCTNAALVIDFSKYMNRVLAIDPEGRTARVEPGVVQSQLNAAAAPHGLFFAPDPSTRDRCTIGGMIGNNSCGAHSAAYGKTVDNLVALDTMLYDGTRLRLGGESGEPKNAPSARAAALIEELRAIADRNAQSIRANYPKLPRRVSGYNLDELLPERGFNVARAMVGSEGTLGVTLAATVRLVPRPSHTALAVLGFEDVYRAADQMPWMLEHRPEALEGFDGNLPDFARAKGVAAVKLLPDGRAFLLVELGGASADEARGRGERLLGEVRRIGACSGTALLSDGREQLAVWRIRESGLPSGVYIPGHPRTWPGAEDTAVPPARLGAYLRRFDALLACHELSATCWYGHFGEGCIHARINFDLASESGIATFRTAMHEIGELVVEFGGSLSGEHGDGVARSELLPMMYPSDLMHAFADFKRAFDPDGRMNPGVIVNPHPLDSHLKLGPPYAPREVTTSFDFSADQGLAGALLKCVGIGKCRKTDAGTMCPSYMATRDELHSTRGRARILFDAINGGVLEGGFADEGAKEALDLCLACKSCKTECPASLDMAAYRSEYFSHYYRKRLRPLAAQFFGRMHEIARLASLAPGVANALMHAPALALLGKRALGIEASRVLPRFAPRSFRSSFQPHNSDGREVVLFADTFNDYFDAENMFAAAQVLESSGFRVTIPKRDLCCGRPLYDQGMLDRAKRRLSEVMNALAPFAERGVPIVGLEPSCILTFRDELPSLFPHDPRAHALARGSFMFDEFMAREASALPPLALEGRAIVHGHCHQKALAGMDGTIELLTRVRGLEVRVLDAGCCGMAGAFGYAREHFAVSRAIGERVLFPEIEKAAPDALIIADGFSCRAQVAQFCPGRRPMHLASLLRLAVQSRP